MRLMILLGLAGLGCLLPLDAHAQMDSSGADLLRPPSHTFVFHADDTGQSIPLIEECDGDLDGALIGTLIGASPLIIAALIGGMSDGSSDEFISAVGVGAAGAFLGFWIGLAVDSANCKTKE